MFKSSSRGRSAPSRTNVGAVVKWFNPEKGFGFVTPDDGTPDAFLHISVVERSGFSVGEGTAIVCDMEQGQKGPQVSAIHEITGTRALPPKTGGRGFAPSRSSSSYSGLVEGTVKFFDTGRGFGFITPDDGSKDIFIPISALRRSGLEGLGERQRVRFTVSDGIKGPQADRIEII